MVARSALAIGVGMAVGIVVGALLTVTICLWLRHRRPNTEARRRAYEWDKGRSERMRNKYGDDLRHLRAVDIERAWAPEIARAGSKKERKWHGQVYPGT